MAEKRNELEPLIRAIDEILNGATLSMFETGFIESKHLPLIEAALAQLEAQGADYYPDKKYWETIQRTREAYDKLYRETHGKNS